jgi:hypothetical protein
MAAAATTYVLWVLITIPKDGMAAPVFAISLIYMWLFLPSDIRAHQSRTFLRKKQHALLRNDRQGFMADLRLDAKTAIFDGSNIYHFGHHEELDARPLGLLAAQLRNEGYRIVCFFDANIYYTLSEHGAFPDNHPHTLDLLQVIFGLAPDEIYVVPSGVQADKYLLECLKHMPISFAVTNDQFRDYAKQYPAVMKGNQWRKGVMVSKNEIKLLQHKLARPIRLRE